MDSRLLSYFTLILNGKRCSRCYNSYKVSDINREIPLFGTKAKQNYARFDYGCTLTYDYEYVSGAADYTRDKYTVTKNKTFVRTVIIEITCSNCGISRYFELPIEYFGI